MTKVNLDPSSTIANSGTRTGGSTVHGVLSDDSDATYMEYALGNSSRLGLEDLSLPSGALLIAVTAFTRVSRVNAFNPSTTIKTVLLMDVDKDTQQNVTWVTPTDIAGAVGFFEMSDAGVDAGSLQLQNNSISSVYVYKAWVQCLYFVKPTVTVNLPTGTVNDNTPVVAWTGTVDPDISNVHYDYEVKIFDSATYGAGGFDPDTSAPVDQSGELSAVYIPDAGGYQWTGSVALADGSYRAYVRHRSQQSPLQWSDWDYEGFTVDADRPGVPAFSANGEDANGRVSLALSDTPGEGSTTSDKYQIQRASYRDWKNVMLGLKPSFLLPMAGPEALVDLAGNYTAEGAGGIVPGGVSPGPLLGDNDLNGATAFDGSNDRILTNYSTRQNHNRNPSGESVTTRWSAPYGTFALSSEDAWVGSQCFKWTATSTDAPRLYNHIWFSGTLTDIAIAAAAGDVVSYTVRLKALQPGYRVFCQFYFYNGTPALESAVNGYAPNTTSQQIVELTEGEWTDVEFYRVAPANTAAVGFNLYLDYDAVVEVGDVVYADGAITEIRSSGQDACGSYFDGSGYKDDNDVWIADPGGHVGWVGAEHASASNKGFLANGTTRTAIAWIKQDVAEDAVVLADSQSAYNILIRPNSAGGVSVFADGGSFVAIPGGSLDPGDWNRVAIVITENAGTMTFESYVNGELVADSSASRSWKAPTGSGAQIGAYASGSQPWDGNMFGVAVFERGLSAEEIKLDHDLGREWIDVRTAEGDGFISSDANDDAFLYDHEAPIGKPVLWRARSFDESDSTYSEWAMDLAAWTSTDGWLKHPAYPSMNLAVTVRSYSDVNRAANQGVFRPLGSAVPVVVSDVRGPKSGSVVLLCDDENDRDALYALLDLGGPLLLQVSGEPDRWVVLSDQSGSRLIDNSIHPHTDESFPWTEVDRPETLLAE